MKGVINMRRKSTKVVENRAYRFRLYPNKEQSILINKTIGCARLIYNSLLQDKKKYYEETGLSLKKEVSEYKKEKEFLKEVDSLALSNAKVNLETAFTNFFKKRSKYPKLHKKGKHDSYTTNNVNNNIEIVDKKIKLPKIGFVKIKQHRTFGNDEIIKSATISKVGGNYYISVLTAREPKPVEKKEVSTISEDKVLGLDFSIPHFYADSEGNVSEYPKYYRNAQKKLAKEQRKLSRKEYRSHNYFKQLQKVQKLQEHIANQRKDFLHKLSAKLVSQYDAICFEDINLTEMSKTYKFGKSIGDEGFGIFRTMVKYKLEREGKYFILIDKWFASSKTCSVCNEKNNEITLNTREWICPHCNTHHDRDYNAAINIKNEGYRMLIA